ncbi:GFA family protein [Acidocella sp.]|uniref:GFA family protein n=1 Tax=Acidocella sp. TaxID=50710 RepID=UPI00260A27AC|nr:GFA family protein [Acidocella sp.]
MNLPLTGGCACGQVRYECSAEPLFTAHCHCRDCQKAGGGQMSTVSGVPSAAMRLVQGETTSFHYAGSSGKGIDRHFCATCGARLFSDHAGAMPGVTFIAVGNLDEPARVTPQMHIFTASAQPWATIPPDMPQFPGMPG